MNGRISLALLLAGVSIYADGLCGGTTAQPICETTQHLIGHGPNAKTFSLAQPPITNFACESTSGAQPTCSVTATITAGHTLVFLSAVTTVNSGTGPVVAANPTGDAFVVGLDSVAPIPSGAGQYGNVAFAYVLSAAGGTNVYTFTWTAGGSPDVYIEDVWLYDLVWSGSSVTFDTKASISTNTGCTTCPAPTISFTGPDAVFQVASNIFGAYTAISGGYTGSFESSQGVYGATAYKLNLSSYTIPDWTTGSAGASGFIAAAFKGN